MIRKHIIIGALALAAALAAQTNQASATRIDCDQRGCREVSARHAGPAEARHRRGRHRTARHSHRHRETHQRASLAGFETATRAGWETIRSAAGGAALVARSAAGRFTAYIRDLEAHGAKIFYMGGVRRGRCSTGSQHPCGLALDVCQDYRGHVSGERDCRLPPPKEMAAIAKAHGLNEGSLWCRRPDYGHAQVIPTGSECPARGSASGSKHYLASITGKIAEAP